MKISKVRITKENFDAVLFDLDGVVTSTAKVHASCWKKMFDEYLEKRAKRENSKFQPFDYEEDYKHYVDGKPRYDGVRSFLESRGITLPEGSPDSPPTEESVCGLGNRKNALIHEVLNTDGADIFEGSVKWIKHLQKNGVRTAVVSSSKNCEAILKVAGLQDLFEVKVDGVVAYERKLPGKPAPDTFLEAAKLMGTTAKRSVVIEDAISGVQAGRAGNFGLVVGVDRKDDSESLLKNGADIVVKDLGEFLP